MGTKIDNQGYWNLVYAVLEQAGKDLRALYRHTSNNYKRSQSRSIKEIENFFRSKWYMQLTNTENGEYILREIRKEFEDDETDS